MGREALVVLLRSLVVEYLGRSPWVVITSRRITRFLVKYGFRHGRWEYIIIEGALRCLAGRVGGVDYTRRSAGRGRFVIALPASVIGMDGLFLECVDYALSRVPEGVRANYLGPS